MLLVAILSAVISSYKNKKTEYLDIATENLKNNLIIIKFNQLGLFKLITRRWRRGSWKLFLQLAA